MNKLYIVRHGETDWNNKGLLQGTTDIELNKEGIKQVQELSKIIDLDKIDICICSPLKRTKETAKILVSNKKKIIYDEMLIERDYGDYEGKKINYDEIIKQWNYKLNDKSYNIESIQECLLRAKIFLDKVKQKYDGKNILVVSHGSFIKALHFNLVGYNEDTDFLSFNPNNAIIYEYDME